MKAYLSSNPSPKFASEDNASIDDDGQLNEIGISSDMFVDLVVDYEERSIAVWMSVDIRLAGMIDRIERRCSVPKAPNLNSCRWSTGTCGVDDQSPIIQPSTRFRDYDLRLYANPPPS
jgi:hypothetical protein